MNRNRRLLIRAILLLLAGASYWVCPAPALATGPQPFSPSQGEPRSLTSVPAAGGDRDVDQPPDLNGFKMSSEIISAFGLVSMGANDFETSQRSYVTHVTWWGGPYNWSPGDPPITQFTLEFGTNTDPCNPTAVLSTYWDLSPAITFVAYDPYGYPVYQYDLDLSPPFTANGHQIYWLSIFANDHPYPPDWGRLSAMNLLGCESMWQSAYWGYPTWTKVSDVIGVVGDFSQRLTTVPTGDIVLCEPQGGSNPYHPTTFWYNVDPADYGRCDFHVQVYDPDPAHYTSPSLPYSTWQFQVHAVGTEWWASWWDPACQNAIFSPYRFRFTHNGPATWGGWTTTTGASSDPHLMMVDNSGNHTSDPDGYGSRVHVPGQHDQVVCEPQGSGNPVHPIAYWYDVTPDTFGRCDFHVKVLDPDPGNYSTPTLPAPSWQFAVHTVGSEYWASWWDPGCGNAIYNTFRFQFNHHGSASWNEWRTTIDGTNNPAAQVTDRSSMHAGEPDGYGYRVQTPGYVTPVTFTASDLTGVKDAGASWGDMDGDGDLDLAVCGESISGRVTQIYRNNAGSMVLNQSLEGISNESSGALDWGDFDLDGDLDLAMAGTTANGRVAQVYINNGSGQLLPGPVLIGVGYASVAWGDADLDGDLDLVVIGHDGTNARSILYRNHPPGNLAPDSRVDLRDLYAGSADWADWDGDGDFDLLLTGSDGTAQQVVFYRNDSSRCGLFTMTDIGSQGLTGVAYSDAAWGDFDADGDLDLAYTGSTGAGAQTSRIYRNTGSGSLVLAATLPGLYRSGCAWGDYDTDGDLDLILAGYNGSDVSTQLFRNLGGTFTATGDTFVGLNRCAVTWVDVDTDGRLDLFVTGLASSGTRYARLYKHAGGIVNTAPSPPTGFSWGAESHSDSLCLRLNWSGASDADTPTSGLYYCVRVGTTPSGNDLLSGTYATPLMGNVGQGTGQVIVFPSLLQTFYWSVRSIDSGLRASGWSSPQWVSGVDQPEGQASSFLLLPNAPNPFQATTLISYRLNREGQIRLTVHDPGGRIVRRLLETRQGPGVFSAIWDGRDDSGRRVGSGVYFYRIDAEGKHETRPMTMLQ